VQHMKRVLVIGNGFDLAHGLPTSYADFLNVLKKPNLFKMAIEEAKESTRVNTSKAPWSKYLMNASNISCSNINAMLNYVKNCSWANYFIECNAEINGWVDFEHEMIPAIQMFQMALRSSVEINYFGGRRAAIFKTKNPDMIRMQHLWPLFFEFHGTSETNGEKEYIIAITENYSDDHYGVLKGKLLDDLYRDFRLFVDAFCTYLKEMASFEQTKNIELFSRMEVTDIITFNYTKTHLKYYSDKRINVYYIHGSIDDSSSVVMGVNSVENDKKNEFKDYEKSSQRLLNNVKQKYRDIAENGGYELHIFGHSLDETDKNILKPLIQKSEHTTVYYVHSETRNGDYFKKIKNLTILLGRKKAEDMLYKELIELEGV